MVRVAVDGDGQAIRRTVPQESLPGYRVAWERRSEFQTAFSAPRPISRDLSTRDEKRTGSGGPTPTAMSDGQAVSDRSAGQISEPSTEDLSDEISQGRSDRDS